MVATTFIAPDLDSRWLKYIGLSILVNLLLISIINIGNLPQKLAEMPMLKVNLMALAAPAPEPVKQQFKQLSPPPAIKKVMTEHQAKKKMAALKPLATNQPAAKQSKPIAEKMPQKLSALQPSAGVPSKNQGKQTSTVIHEANYRKQTPPTYPRRAFELGQEGTVTLHAEVTPSGLPRELKIAKSSGHRLLDMAALAAVKKWEFEPTNVNGNTITSWVRVPVRFVIQ